MSVKSSWLRERVSTRSRAERASSLPVGHSSKIPGAGRNAGVFSAWIGSPPARQRRAPTTTTKTRIATRSNGSPLPGSPAERRCRVSRDLSGEEAALVPHQEEALARRVLGDADELPAVPGVLVDRLLQGYQRGTLPAARQRNVLGVVALGLRCFVGFSLSLGHVPPFPVDGWLK